MKEFFKKDLTLKIFSIAFAIFLWFTINPVKTNYYTVPLTIINEESLRAKGIVLNSKAFPEKYVTISVRDRVDVLDRIKDNDFEVTLDLSRVKSVEDKVIAIDTPVYLGRENISGTNMELKPKSVTLDLGKIEENPFIVQVETSGKLPANYEIISKTAAPDTVSIQALDSVINSVGSVKVYVDVTGLNKTLEVKKECKVYDKKGVEMTELSKKFTVDIRIEVGKRIPIVPIISGNPEEDYVEGEYSVKPDNILITGDNNILQKVNEIKTAPVSLDNMTKSFTTPALLQLPEGVRLVNSTREVNVTVEILPLAERTVDIPVDSISIEGRKTEDATLNYEISSPVSVKLKGKVEDVNTVSYQQLLATIDVDGLDEGNHNVPLKITLPGNITQAGEVRVQVKITKGAD
ncbi:YbbR-like protein [Ruminiclostridium hungatei]|uniref:YbbR-like protein n=1 Tax=Ruminiclostridium hungatei TaxID=48256 RepID=A0A1V4SG45_RUMHU|nr:CdaR family protein [Ruminiclostridium hungatei]OPX42764.1 YbbR-like protein [Ruminiclostridium hungatei]